MTFTCKIWISTAPQEWGPARLRVAVDGKEVTDLLRQWPRESTIGSSCTFGLVGGKDSKAVVRRLSRALDDRETVKCEIEIPPIGKFDGRFSVKSTDALYLNLSSFREWDAEMAPAEQGSVQFRPAGKMPLPK